jgi:hypothetical protein
MAERCRWSRQKLTVLMQARNLGLEVPVPKALSKGEERLAKDGMA